MSPERVLPIYPVCTLAQEKAYRNRHPWAQRGVPRPRTKEGLPSDAGEADFSTNRPSGPRDVCVLGSFAVSTNGSA